MRQLSWKTTLYLSALSTAIGSLACPEPIEAAPPERPNLNHTADPRPNILPDEIFNHHEPYRLRYNRPRYHVGKSLYYVISPTSQEALVWKENLDNCQYEGKDCPPVYKSFYYPKPWEILNTGPRPNFSTTAARGSLPNAPATSQLPTAPSNSPPKMENVKENGSAEKNLDKVPAPN